MPRPNRGPEVRYRKDRKTWGVMEFRQGKRHWLATGLGSREDAQTEYVAILTKKTTVGKYTPDKRLVGDVLAAYQLECGPRVLHPNSIIYPCQNLATYLGNDTVSQLTKVKCQWYMDVRIRDYKKKTGRTLSRGTIRNELSNLKAALKHDYNEGRLTSVPPIWRPPAQKPRQRWLTRQEAARLIREARKLNQAGKYLPLFIMIGIHTGARREAILSLRWDQIDFIAGTLYVLGCGA